MTLPLAAEPPARRTLRGIIDELLERIDAAQGEVTDDVELLELSIEQKVEAYGAVIKQWEAEKAAYADLERAYALKKARRDEQIARLKQRLQDQLERVGCPKIKTKTVTASWRETESVEIDDEEKFCMFYQGTQFVRAKLSPDKPAVKRELGLDGAEMVGARIKTTRSLQLR